MDSRADVNAFFATEYHSKPKHLGAIGLHLEISNGPGLGLGGDIQTPTKACHHILIEEGVITDPLDPLPVAPIEPLVLVQHGLPGHRLFRRNAERNVDPRHLGTNTNGTK